MKHTFPYWPHWLDVRVCRLSLGPMEGESGDEDAAESHDEPPRAVQVHRHLQYLRGQPPLSLLGQRLDAARGKGGVLEKQSE